MMKKTELENLPNIETSAPETLAAPEIEHRQSITEDGKRQQMAELRLCEKVLLQQTRNQKFSYLAEAGCEAM